jgi:hypothetical protein
MPNIQKDPISGHHLGARPGPRRGDGFGSVGIWAVYDLVRGQTAGGTSP